MNLHLFYDPPTGHIYGAPIFPDGSISELGTHIATIEKNLSIKEALERLVSRGLVEMVEDEPNEPWEQDSDWWKG